MIRRVSYRNSTQIMKKDLIFTPGLGYTPVVVKEKRVLDDATVEEIKKYTGYDPVPEVYVIDADPEYLDLLRKSGFSVNPLSHEDIIPIMLKIYNPAAISRKYRVYGKGVATSYPPLGYYDEERMRVFVYEPVSNNLGILVHENVHHALNIESSRLRELAMVDESVAGFCEVLAELNCPPTPLQLLAKALQEHKILDQLTYIVKATGVEDEIQVREYGGLPEPVAIFATLVSLIEEMDINPCDVAGIIRGEKCVKDYGLFYIIGKCEA